jgi:mono/diheme cytochrome c family protein
MRTFFLSALSLILAGVWYLGTTVWVEGRPPSSRTSKAREGDTARLRGAAGLYTRYCARCHGDDFTGNGWRERGRQLPNFSSAAWQHSRSDAQLLVSIVEGKGARMPAFGDRLSQAQARDLVLLIRSANPARPATASIGRDDFDRRYAALLRELEELRKQFRELGRPPRRPARGSEPKGFTTPVRNLE